MITCNAIEHRTSPVTSKRVELAYEWKAHDTKILVALKYLAKGVCLRTIASFYAWSVTDEGDSEKQTKTQNIQKNKSTITQKEKTKKQCFSPLQMNGYISLQ